MKSVPAESSSTAKEKTELKEDEVDKILSKADGRIERKHDPEMCNHNSNSRCVHCAPLDPYNEEYLKEHKINHLSFYSYIRKLQSGADRGKIVALEDYVCYEMSIVT